MHKTKQNSPTDNKLPNFATANFTKKVKKCTKITSTLHAEPAINTRVYLNDLVTVNFPQSFEDMQHTPIVHNFEQFDTAKPTKTKKKRRKISLPVVRLDKDLHPKVFSK